MTEDLYVFDPIQEDFVPNPEVTTKENYGDDIEDTGGAVIVNYDQINGYMTYQPGGSNAESLYPPGTFYVVSQTRHIAIDGTIRVDVVVEIVDDIPGKQYELRVTRS